MRILQSSAQLSSAEIRRHLHNFPGQRMTFWRWIFIPNKHSRQQPCNNCNMYFDCSRTRWEVPGTSSRMRDSDNLLKCTSRCEADPVHPVWEEGKHHMTFDKGWKELYGKTYHVWTKFVYTCMNIWNIQKLHLRNCCKWIKSHLICSNQNLHQPAIPVRATFSIKYIFNDSSGNFLAVSLMVVGWLTCLSD